MQTVRLPAPIGGLNTVDAGMAFPASDAVRLWNVIPSEYGLKCRSGYREVAIIEPPDNTGGALPPEALLQAQRYVDSSNEVRTILPFHGSKAQGASDRLFAVSSKGIWDVTAGGTVTAEAVRFDSWGDRAGFGVWHVCSAPGGRYLLYCDEENGLYIYSENSETFQSAEDSVEAAWTASTIYEVGDTVYNGDNIYECVSGGTSDDEGGPTGNGQPIVDGTAVWAFVEEKPTPLAGWGYFGASLADQQLGLSFSVKNVVAVTVWKSRIWLVERDSTRAWYLAPNAVFGEVTSYDFGGKFRAGGDLRNLYSWSYDGGGGLDTSLVAVSGGGDVAIYQGTDPQSATTFGLKGVWSVGSVPAGRRIATEYGGDLMLLSQTGIVSASRLVVGGEETDNSIYSTRKIANLFGPMATAGRSRMGWATAIHPTDNALLVLAPTGTPPESPVYPTLTMTGASDCLAMSLATKGWSRLRGLPIISADSWEGSLYFGTPDSRVCINAGHLDCVALDDSTISAPFVPNMPIECAVLTGFNNLGTTDTKKVLMLRPAMSGASHVKSLDARAAFDWDALETYQLGGTGMTGTRAEWNAASWDVDSFDGGDSGRETPILSATGCGRDVAVWVKWLSTDATALIGVDIHFEKGGPL